MQFKEWLYKEELNRDELLKQIRLFILGSDEHVPEQMFRDVMVQFADEILDLPTTADQKWISQHIKVYCDKFAGDRRDELLGNQNTYYRDDWE